MLVPSIDIMNGKVVQLRQGRELVLSIDKDPVELAREFNRFGEVAVIDLDAAMGKGDNLSLIKKICDAADCRVGGGIRNVERARELLKAGARRLIFGTAASPELLSKFPAELCMVALDNRQGKVVDRGWTNDTNETVLERARKIEDYCGSYLVTFVENEGCLGGLDVEAASQLASQLDKPITVAGGIRELKEIVDLARNGIDAQVGMALYTDKIDPSEVFVESLTYDSRGLIPTVVQDARGQVLMMAYSSKDSLKLALTQGKGVYFSRSRQCLWEKGATSGAVQELIAARTDCDRDCLIFTVKQTDVACHKGSYSCFDKISVQPEFDMNALFETLAKRKEKAPPNSYSASLFADRELLVSKLKEEMGEVISFESGENLKWEIADVLYFLSVLAVDEGISWNDIQLELRGRMR